MSTITEGVYYGECIVSCEGEAVETVTIASGNNLTAGYVVAKTHTLTAAKLTMAAGANTGNGTLTLAKAGHDIKIGTYTITCTAAATNGGTFSVTAPDTTVLPPFTLTAGAGLLSWYWHPQIEFIITDGGTDFIVGDSFTIVVAAATTPVVVGTGNGTCTSVAFGPHARPGNYFLRLVTVVAHGGVFELVGPDNEVISVFPMGTTTGAAMSYLDRREVISFTLTDGSTDFVLGDYFAIAAVKAATFDYYTPWTVGIGSREDADMAVLLNDTDATSAATLGTAIVRNAEVKASALQWSGSPTAGSKATAYALLNKQGIAVRS